VSNLGMTGVRGCGSVRVNSCNDKRALVSIAKGILWVNKAEYRRARSF